MPDYKTIICVDVTKKSNGDNKTNEKIGKPYQAPTLTFLNDINIYGGSVNVPEATNGILES